MSEETWHISEEAYPPLMLASPFYDILDDQNLIVARVASKTDADHIISDHQQAQQVAALRAALTEAIPWLEHSFQPTHDGPCTPETPCDMTCVDNAALSELLHRSRALAAISGKEK